MLSVNPTLYVGISTRSESTFRPIDFELHELTAHLDGEPLRMDLRVWQPAAGGSTPRPDVTLAFAIIEVPDEWMGREIRLHWRIQIVDFQTRAPIGDPWIETRTFTLDHEIDYDGARRQDDKAPPRH